MLSLSAFLATLPPAALAETDLARFAALVIGRRQRHELPGLALLLAEENIRGYPAGLAPLLRATIEELIQDETPPELVDAAGIEMLFGRETFLARLSRLVEVRRERLRPGTLVGPELRLLAGKRLQILESLGAQLVLIYPVDLARVPTAHFAVPRGPVLATMLGPTDAEVLRETWSAIEAATGLDGDDAASWTARFFAISRRPGIDVGAVQKAIVRMSPELRTRLADTLIAHCRDGRLPEHHRPGPRGLERRLARLGLEADAPWVEAVTALVYHAFEGAGVDPEVERGYCFVPPDDLALWAQWVEVPAAARDRVAAMAPHAVEDALMVLAEIEAGRVDRDLDPVLRRGLQSLRDHCLRPRWLKSRAVLEGLDLLRLCDAFMARGWDLRERQDALRTLAAEAEQAMASRPPPVVSEEVGPPMMDEFVPGQWRLGDVPSGHGHPTPIDPPREFESARRERPLGGESGEQPGHAEALSAEPVSGSMASRTVDGPEPSRIRQPSRQLDTGTSNFRLPPMPKPPPLRTRPGLELGAAMVSAAKTSAAVPGAQPSKPLGMTALPATMAESPPRLERVSDRDRQRARVLGRPATGTEAVSLATRSGNEASAGALPTISSPTVSVPTVSSPTVSVPTVSAPTRSAPDEPRAAPRQPTRAPTRPASAALLVTPAQAHAFYEQAFRDLETIERDILKGGRAAPSLQARLDAIAEEAAAVAAACGPAARSGDRDFQVALERIERVEGYLLRIRGLELAGGGPRSDRPKSWWRKLFGNEGDPG